MSTVDLAKLKIWIEKATKSEFSDKTSFHKSFKDGVILAKLISAVTGNKDINYDPEGKTIRSKLENIKFFVSECEKIGLTISWSARDLYAGKEMTGVLNSLCDLCEKSETLNKGFEGPFISSKGVERLRSKLKTATVKKSRSSTTTKKGDDASEKKKRLEERMKKLKERKKAKAEADSSDSSITSSSSTTSSSASDRKKALLEKRRQEEKQGKKQKRVKLVLNQKK